MDPVSDDEMPEVSEFEYDSSTGDVTETVPDSSDVNMDDRDDDICDFGPNVPNRIVLSKSIVSRRFLEVRRKVERGWRIRNENLTRTLD